MDSTARLPAPNMSENIPAYSGKWASIRHMHWVLSSATMPRSDCRQRDSDLGDATSPVASLVSSHWPMRSASAMSPASTRSFLTLSSPLSLRAALTCMGFITATE